MYPLKMKKNLKEKIWGGHKFKEKLNFELIENKKYGESWELSCRKDVMSYVENGELKGKSIFEIIEMDRKNILGEDVVKKFNNKFPLLIKYLDINDKLSVQVHPNDTYAMEVEKELGKSESWYVMEASSDAKLIIGTKAGISKKEFEEKVKNKDFSDIFNYVNVKTGDFIDLKPGTVHASVEGNILICEPQENSDVTYRIYDFDRKVNGKYRELKLEKAMEVIDFSAKPKISSILSRKKENFIWGQKEELKKGKHFSVDKFLIDGEFKDEINKNFKIYSVLNGNGYILCNNKKYSCKKGETFFIAAKLETVINGKIEILKTYI